MKEQSKKIQELEELIKELEKDAENGFASHDTVNGLKNAIESFKAGDKEKAFFSMIEAIYFWTTWRN